METLVEASARSERIARMEHFVERNRRLIGEALREPFSKVENVVLVLRELDAEDRMGLRKPDWELAFGLLESALDELLKATDADARRKATNSILEMVSSHQAEAKPES